MLIFRNPHHLLLSMVLTLAAIAIAAPFAVSFADDPPQRAVQRAALGSAFVYQGRLESGGSPANGDYDFSFALYDEPVAGNLVAGPIVMPNVPVVDALFAVTLDFGQIFDGRAFYLEVEIEGEALSARQQLRPVPQALYASTVDPTYAQRRVNGECPAGGSIRAIAENGSVTCEPDDSGLALPFSATSSDPDALFTLTNTHQGGVIRATSQGGPSSAAIEAVAGATQFTLGTERVGVRASSQIGVGVQGWSETRYGVVGLLGVNPAGCATLNPYLQGGVIGCSSVGGSVNTNPGVLGVNIASGPGVSAVSYSGTGLYASGQTGAIYGTTIAGTGVLGSSQDSNGVYGLSFSGVGVHGLSSNSSGVHAESQGPGPALFAEALSTGPAISALNDATGPTAVFRQNGSGDILQAAIPGVVVPNVRFRVANDGDVTADGSFTGGGADLAEFVPVIGLLEPGDVVEIDPESGLFRLAGSAASALVAGVISTDPGVVLGGSGAEEDSVGPRVALAGRVPVKVSMENGPIRPGDLLVSAEMPGHAMKAPANPSPGTVIGKALGFLDSGSGLITMLVMLR